MSSITEDQVLDILQKVSVPGETNDVVELGLVSGLVVRDGLVQLSIETTPDKVPEMEEVLFKSKMIGGGEETTLELDPNVFISGKEYIFICSFPGHFALMKGKLNI